MKLNRSQVITAAVVAAALVLMAIVIADLWPLFAELIDNRKNEAASVDYVKTYGAKAVPILLLAEVLLVATTVISADPVMLLIGLCYGVAWGGLICLVGLALGNALVFLVARKFNKVFGRGSKKSKKEGFLSVSKLDRMKHPELIAFLIYLIPGIPNGIVPVVFAKTKVTFTQYLASVTIAGVPGIILCTWAGKSIAHRDWRTIGVIAIVVIAVVAIVLLLKNKLIKRISTA